MARKSKSRWKWITASVLITLTAAVPLSTFILPPIHRWYMLEKLVSEDPQVRMEGQKYFLAFAETKPEVLAGAVERLTTAPETPFRELVWIIDQAGFWERQQVGNDAWLRWLDWVASDGDPEARLMAPQHIADDVELALADRSRKIVTTLAGDPDSSVRYNTLVAVAEMHGIAVTENNTAAADHFLNIMQSATADADPVIARQAWMFCGLLKRLPDTTATTTADNTPDHAASLWARAQAGTADWTTRAKNMLANEAAPATDRAMAAYLLAGRSDPALDELIALIKTGPTAITPQNQLFIWRAILNLPLPGKSESKAQEKNSRALTGFLYATTRAQFEQDQLLRPVILAAVYRDHASAAFYQPDGGIHEIVYRDPLLALASLEGVRHMESQDRAVYVRIRINEQTPEMVRLADFRAKLFDDDETYADYMPLFLSESPEIRDLACLTASQRLSKADCAKIVRALWRRPQRDDTPDQPIYIFDDHAKISGGMLAALADIEHEALDQMAYDFDDRWLVRDMLHLAQWMQGRPPEKKDVVSYMTTLLVRDDVPRSSILLGLFKRRPDLALDYLLTPRGDLNQDLIVLLEQFRWWHVLNHYLPPSAPKIELWGDPELIAFQVDLLRNWYALHRYGIARESKR